MSLFKTINTTDSNLLKFSKGHGYWDVTFYPYGGDFKRLAGNETGHLIRGTVKYDKREIRVKLNNGNTIVIEANAVSNFSIDKLMELKERLNK